MLSSRLRNFFIVWCNADADIDEVADIIRESPDYGFPVWLQAEFRAAIEEESLTPELAYKLTSIGFDDRKAVEAWQRDLWAKWFPDDPYPGGAARDPAG